MLTRIKGERHSAGWWRRKRQCHLYEVAIIDLCHVVHTFQLPSARKVAGNCRGLGLSTVSGDPPSPPHLLLMVDGRMFKDKGPEPAGLPEDSETRQCH
jgi:hypothetical protein